MSRYQVIAKYHPDDSNPARIYDADSEYSANEIINSLKSLYPIVLLQDTWSGRSQLVSPLLPLTGLFS